MDLQDKDIDVGLTISAEQEKTKRLNNMLKDKRRKKWGYFFKWVIGVFMGLSVLSASVVGIQQGCASQKLRKASNDQKNLKSQILYDELGEDLQKSMDRCVKALGLETCLEVQELGVYSCFTVYDSKSLARVVCSKGLDQKLRSMNVSLE